MFAQYAPFQMGVILNDTLGCIDNTVVDTDGNPEMLYVILIPDILQLLGAGVFLNSIWDTQIWDNPHKEMPCSGGDVHVFPKDICLYANHIIAKPSYLKSSPIWAICIKPDSHFFE
jgi:hypothetical protein